jgi:cell division protein FtsI (penicillin-binding protein 3)
VAEQRVTSNLDREFLYVARHLDPDKAAEIRKLGIPGVSFEREYKRFYPNGEVTAHLLGFTNLDEEGSEGLELAYNRSLAGKDGAKRVIQDGRGQVIRKSRSEVAAAGRGPADQHRPSHPVPGVPRAEVRNAGIQCARGTVIVLDIASGEVLAMVNQPSFNPNDRMQFDVASLRNRAVTDIFEPGSSIKPFVMAAALVSGKYNATARSTRCRSRSRRMSSGTTTTSARSASARCLHCRPTSGWRKIALSLDRSQMHDTLSELGFGKVTESGFPGESAGRLSSAQNWRPINISTMAYGYGLSVTPLQLAQAYATVGAFGVHRPITFRRVTEPPAGHASHSRAGRA